VGLVCYFYLKLIQTEGFESTLKYTFIHIPKNSGTSIYRVLNNYKNNFDLTSNKYHNLVATKYNNPILCIRDPISRFKSIYKYWKKNVNFINVSTTLKDFIAYMKQNSLYLIIPEILSEYHYFSQSKYIDKETYPYTRVIIYSSDRDIMNSKVNSLLNDLNIKNNIELPYENSTDNEDIQLDMDDMNFIYQEYKDDFELWENVNTNPSLFLKVY